MSLVDYRLARLVVYKSVVYRLATLLPELATLSLSLSTLYESVDYKFVVRKLITLVSLPDCRV